MQKVASSIGFLEQALYYQFTPTLAKLKGHVISSINKKQVDKKVTKKHLFEHRNNLKHLRGRHYNIINELLKLVGKVILRIYKAKNKKIVIGDRSMLIKQVRYLLRSYLIDIDTSSLKYGLNHSFIDKNKFIKRDLEVEFESLVTSVDELVTQEQEEEFHEFLQHTTDLLAQNVYHTKDNTFIETNKI